MYYMMKILFTVNLGKFMINKKEHVYCNHSNPHSGFFNSHYTMLLLRI